MVNHCPTWIHWHLAHDGSHSFATSASALGRGVALNLRPAGYVDATFGRGGHTAALLAALGPEGRLLALDRDPTAQQAAKRFDGDSRFIFAQTPFSRLAEWIAKQGWSGRVDGILLDLGVSSPQLDDPMRGFSFAQDGPLDMRMDPADGISAAEWLDQIEEAELARVLANTVGSAFIGVWHVPLPPHVGRHRSPPPNSWPPS